MILKYIDRKKKVIEKIVKKKVIISKQGDLQVVYQICRYFIKITHRRDEATYSDQLSPLKSQSL